MANPNPPNSVPVFLDSTLDTHFAMLVQSNETIATLKRKIEMEHIAAFPDFGEVVVRGIKVRRREHMYDLSDSMDVSSAFHGVESGGRFFHVEVIPAKEKTKIVKFGVMSESEKPVQKNRKEYSSKKKEATTLLHPPQRVPSGVGLSHVALKESLPSENLCSTQTDGNANVDDRLHIKPSTDLTAGRVKTGQIVKSNNKRKTREASKEGREVSQEKNKVTDKSEKKRSRKTKGSSSVMIAVAPPVREIETEGREETLRKGDPVLEKGMDTSSAENLGDATLDASNQVNQTEGLPIEKLGSALLEFDRDKQNIETMGSINQTDRATEEQADPTALPPFIVETKEGSRKGSSNSNRKDVSQESEDTGIVTPPKKKTHTRTKVSFSEIPSVVPLVRENESRIKDDKENEGNFALQKEECEKQTEGNSGIPENPAGANFVTSDCTDQTEGLPVQKLRSECHSQPITDLPVDPEKRNLTVESKEKSRKVSDNKCKKTKSASFEMLGEDPPVREMEPPVREDIGEHGSNLDLQNGIPENPGDPNPTIFAPNPKNQTDSLLIENLDSTPLELNKETKQTESSSLANENMETNNQPNTNTLAIEQEKPTVEATTFVQSENEKSRKGGGKKTVVSQETTDKLNGDRVVSTNEKKKRKKTKIMSPEVPLDPSKEKPSEKPSTRKEPKENSNPLPDHTSSDLRSPQNQEGKNVSRSKSKGKTRYQNDQDTVKSSIADMAASSDSMEGDMPKPVMQYKVAVRKIPSKRMRNVMNARKRNSDTKFNNSTIEKSSRGEIGSLHKKPVAGVQPRGPFMSADVSRELDDVENLMLAGSDEKGKDSSGDGITLSHS